MEVQSRIDWLNELDKSEKFKHLLLKKRWSRVLQTLGFETKLEFHFDTTKYLQIKTKDISVLKNLCEFYEKKIIIEA